MYELGLNSKGVGEVDKRIKNNERVNIAKK